MEFWTTGNLTILYDPDLAEPGHMSVTENATGHPEDVTVTIRPADLVAFVDHLVVAEGSRILSDWIHRRGVRGGTNVPGAAPDPSALLAEAAQAVFARARAVRESDADPPIDRDETHRGPGVPRIPPDFPQPTPPTTEDT